MTTVTYQITVDFTKAVVSASECKGETSKGQHYLNNHKITDIRVVSGKPPQGVHVHKARGDSSLFWSADNTFSPVTAAPVAQLPPHLAALGALSPEQLAAIVAAVTGTPVAQPVATAPVAQPAPVTATTDKATQLFDKWQLPEAIRDSVRQMVTLAKATEDDKQLRNSVATTIKCFGDFRLTNEAWNSLKSSI